VLPALDVDDAGDAGRGRARWTGTTLDDAWLTELFNCAPSRAPRTHSACELDTPRSTSSSSRR
jgi:hypothetical protein